MALSNDSTTNKSYRRSGLKRPSSRTSSTTATTTTTATTSIPSSVVVIPTDPPPPLTSSTSTTTDVTSHTSTNTNDNSSSVRHTNINVCIRVRPLRTPSPKSSLTKSPPSRKSSTSSLPDSELRSAWTVPPTTTTSLPTTILQSPWTKPEFTRRTTYTFDRVYDQPSTTKQIYNESIRDIVRSAMEGYHGSVFAYGQTSTGKTYTMHGDGKGKEGIIPLAIEDCFDYIRNQTGSVSSSRSKVLPREYLLRVSYMEIYNEQINDLLNRTTSSGTTRRPSSSNIRIFESKDEGVTIRGLTEEIVTTPAQIFELIARGDKIRKVGATNLNARSSRSHTVFRLVIESRVRRTQKQQQPPTPKRNGDDNASLCSDSTGTECGPVRVSSLSLVDLAGSESVKATGSTGHRAKEGVYINKSLMTLGLVIYKLSEWSESKKSSQAELHVPYRDSKLTRLLQPSLRGNAQIGIICNVSPDIVNLEETHNTLKFASRAKKIKQSATITEVVDEKTLLQNYREEIESLKRQLREARREAGTKVIEDGESDDEEEEEKKMVDNNKGAAAVVDEEQDQETKVLVAAIKDLEKLILRNSIARSSAATPTPLPQPSTAGVTTIPLQSSVDPSRTTGHGMSNLDDGIVKQLSELYDEEDDDDDDNLLDDSSHAMPSTPTRPLQPPPPPVPASASIDDADNNDDDVTSQMVTELHRIQKLLGTVLTRKGGSTTTMTSSPPSVPNNDNNNMTVTTPLRDEEVERLKAQLQRQEMASELRQADSSFLEKQLAQKDSLLQDVSKILDTVEKRQVALEAENTSLKKELSRQTKLVALKEREVRELQRKLESVEDEDMLIDF